ncbi:TPA: hypothetical protein JG828_002843 [Vibrio parahaemolyticus]|nr:hypothetical protein [Vibrio parahaemolyticus]
MKKHNKYNGDLSNSLPLEIPDIPVESPDELKLIIAQLIAANRYTLQLALKSKFHRQEHVDDELCRIERYLDQAFSKDLIVERKLKHDYELEHADSREAAIKTLQSLRGLYWKYNSSDEWDTAVENEFIRNGGDSEKDPNQYVDLKWMNPVDYMSINELTRLLSGLTEEYDYILQWYQESNRPAVLSNKLNEIEKVNSLLTAIRNKNHHE